MQFKDCTDLLLAAEVVLPDFSQLGGEAKKVTLCNFIIKEKSSEKSSCDRYQAPTCQFYQ